MSGLLYLLAPTSLAVLASVYLYRSSSQSNKAPLPPGPKGVPLVGNALQMPTHKEWLTYAEWGKKWGDVIYVHVFGSPVIILNSYKAAVDLMEKRSSIYSSRPILTMSNLAGWGAFPSFSPYNNSLKNYRKLFHKALNAEVVEREYRPLIASEVQSCLKRFLDTPKDFRAHVRRTAGAVIMKVTYGYDLIGDNDRFIKVANDAMEAFSFVSRPGAWLVDFVPILQYIPPWFPGAGFRRTAEKLRVYPLNMVELPYQWTKKSMDAGADNVSFASRLIEAGDEEEMIKYAGGALFGGGADTTVSAINAFILAMTLHPDVQKTAHEEIDRIIGRERLPSFTDRPNLPYVEAVVREVLRWNPVTPLGVPHASTEDDLYEGFKIPKGSVIIPNIWFMLHDEKLYKNPFTFNPDRFMPKNGTPEMDPHNCAFGFGRRICPGFQIAKNELWLAVAQILATFNILKALDDNGNEISPSVNFQSGIVSQPEDFKCRLEPRFKDVDLLVIG